jgi:hypothetical protein
MTRVSFQGGDEWYESEQPTRIGLVTELQRIRRRTAVRPIPVVLIAALITAGITYKFSTKPISVEAEVVLALSEGALSSRQSSIPVDQLRAYVASVLLPDAKLVSLIEKYDLYRLRKKLGPEFGLEQLRGSFGIQIWRNSFLYYDEDDQYARRSARIGITMTDSDPDRAFDIARDLASIAIETAAADRQKLADRLSHDIAVLHDSVNDRLAKLSVEMSLKQAAIDDARKHDKPDLATILSIDLASLDQDRKRAEETLAHIATSRDAFAGQIAAAGLDMSLSIVEEHRPERPTRSGLVLVMIAMVVGTGALIGSALVLGAFDSRVHDSDDVARLGLPVLGHVPGFAGDAVGSMQTRSAARARVPSFLRWRSHR